MNEVRYNSCGYYGGWRGFTASEIFREKKYYDEDMYYYMSYEDEEEEDDNAENPRHY